MTQDRATLAVAENVLVAVRRIARMNALEEEKSLLAAAAEVLEEITDALAGLIATTIVKAIARGPELVLQSVSQRALLETV